MGRDLSISEKEPIIRMGMDITRAVRSALVIGKVSIISMVLSIFIYILSVYYGDIAI